MIKAENIFKSYNNGSVKVLSDVSLEIADGEFMAILGASGSGKTTLMSLLSGLERADNGKITSLGYNLDELSDKQLTAFRRENVGFVFQQYYLLSHLTVEKNVKLGANLGGNKDFYGIIEAVGLGEKLKRKPFELSGGEQQRVCIARAVAKKPKVLFLDEPTGALDESTGREVLDYLIKLKREMGFTMIMVTHNQNLAETADTVLKMGSGKIIKKNVNTAPKSAYEIGW